MEEIPAFYRNSFNYTKVRPHLMTDIQVKFIVNSQQLHTSSYNHFTDDVIISL